MYEGAIAGVHYELTEVGNDGNGWEPAGAGKFYVERGWNVCMLVGGKPHFIHFTHNHDEGVLIARRVHNLMCGVNEHVNGD